MRSFVIVISSCHNIITFFINSIEKSFVLINILSFTLYFSASFLFLFAYLFISFCNFTNATFAFLYLSFIYFTNFSAFTCFPFFLISKLILSFLLWLTLNGDKFVAVYTLLLKANSIVANHSNQLFCLWSMYILRYYSSSWFVLSVCSSVCGWYTVDNFVSIPNILFNFFISPATNWGPLSNIILSGNPYNFYTLFLNNLAKLLWFKAQSVKQWNNSCIE